MTTEVIRTGFANEATGSSDGVRTVLRVEGLALTLLAIVLYAKSGESLGRFAALFFVPDASLLFYAFGARIGAIAYNAAHSTIGALMLAAAGASAGRPDLVAIALVWLAHIGFDRALGYGLKRSSGFSDTHLGRIGKARRNA